MQESTKNRNWYLYHLENSWTSLSIAPNLGGRLMQLEMDGHCFFFVNPLLTGKEPDSTRLGEDGSWLNFGGEKIWPAPQGWNSPDQWPGPPDPILDCGIYSLSESTLENGEKAVRLTSPFDPYTGLQIEKEVKLSVHSSTVSVHAEFYNKSTMVREWSIWPVLQMNTSGSDDRYKVICPVRNKSKFINGYKIMHGLVNCPQFQINAKGNFQINYQYLVGKVGLDTDSNWAALIDTKSGKVFVLKFRHEEGKNYPEGTSIQFWTAGKGLIYSRNMIKEYRNDRIMNPPYLEMELLSPLQQIQPGERIQFEYSMQTCSIPVNAEVERVNPFSLVSSSLHLVLDGGRILITGKYGFFKDGIVKLRLKYATDKALDADLYSEKASPFNGMNIKLEIDINKCMFDQEAYLSVDFFDQDGHFVEEIDKVLIN